MQSSRKQNFQYANCTMTSNGQELTLGTVSEQGLWFGNAPSIITTEPISWTLGGTASGNDLSMRAKLGGGASKEFGFYWYDGSHATNFYMTDDNSLEILTSSGSQILSFAAGYFDSYRDIRVILKNGTVGYYVDGTALYVGAAFASSETKLLIIGDGSGSTQTGVGSWVIDEVVFDTAPATVFIPEPGAVGMLGVVGLRALVRRQRTA